MPLFWICSSRNIQKSLLVLQTNVQHFRRFMSENHYEILKLPTSCSSKEIREAFITLSKKNHPDKHIGDPTMHNRFIKINEAYSVLINPISRRNYDYTLKHEKKLKPPPPVVKQQAEQSVRTNVSSAYDDPFMWKNFDQARETKYKENSYYGIEGVKKVSNAAILVLVVLVTLFGVALQLFAIRNSFLRNRDQMMEQSRKYSMLHSMAREKARRYGKEHQIEMLKKTLMATCEVDGSEVSQDEPLPVVEPVADEPVHPVLPVSALPDNTGSEVDNSEMKLCEKCKKKKQPL